LPCFAQVDTGAIAGVVSDGTAAVMPGVHVQISQIETNTITDLRTNEAGFYSAPSLRPGRYEISVSKEGFHPQKSQPFDLRVQDHAEVNFQLEVGATTSEVTVTATASLLESETSSLGQVVEEKNITDLPLNGRNFIQLATLGPGTSPAQRTAERDAFIANGARGVQNSYLLDGIDNRNRIMGFDKSSAQIIQPVIDAIQEFKVQTSTFSAEFGQAAGGVVNVSMKSGTNQLHGSVFEFLRNSEFDATPYFQQNGLKPLFIQNQFGATLGGPIIKDRTFFFGSWQSSREVNAAPQVGTVPTPPQRQGIFSGRVNDPVTKQPFPNNTVPTTIWDPVAAKVFALYPLPSQPGTTRNFSYNPKERVSTDNYNIKVDHHVGSKDYMFGRVSQGWGQNFLPTTLPDPANQAPLIYLYPRQVMVSETHTFTPNLVNEFRLAQVYTRNNQDVSGPRLFEQFGIQGALDTPRIKGLPQFTVSGFSTLGTTGPGTTPIAASGSGNAPADKSGKVWQLVDSMSWVHGRHTFKFGGEVHRITEFVYATNSARPNFTFNGTYTGQALADFMLGYINNTGTSQQQVDTIQQHLFHLYTQDDWKISRTLTLNLGIRYEVATPWVEEFDRQSNFITDSGPCFAQLIPVKDAGRCGLGRALIHGDYNNVAPRVGLAWQADSKTVVRSGFGIFSGRDENIGVARRLPNNPPFITSATFAGDQNNPAFLLKDGFPANALSFASGSTDVNNWPINNKLPYVLQWNINVERQLPGEFVFQVGYTGSGAKKMAGVVAVNQPFPGTGNVNARRPYFGWGNVQSYNQYIASTYNGMIAKLERRFSKGMTLLASYTFGHSIDGGGNNNDASDPGPQDARNTAAQKGNSNFDIRHRFVMSGLYQLPFGKSRGRLHYLVRDWQLSGIFSAQTGQPFTVTSSTDPSGTNTTARPNRLRDGSLPSDQRDINHWFDLTAFTTPTCACFGNSGRNILRGPGFMDLDFGVSRNFAIGERIRIEFRAESFNLMNHPNFGIPGMAIGNQTAGVISTVVNPERQNQLAMKLRF
jgi:hypothetical protein